MEQAGKARPTREKILAVAEQLFARDGIDRITLRQIGRSARQGNVAVVQYHFGSKQKLVSAILDRHRDVIDRRRQEMLEEHDRSVRSDDIDGLFRVLVEPLAERLDDASGRAYLRIQARHLADGGAALRPATRSMSRRIRSALGLRAPDPIRDRFAVLLLFHALADRAAQEEAGIAKKSQRGRFLVKLRQALRGLYDASRKGGTS